MIRRWPLRIRLTAAFTAVMALVLAAVALATVLHSRAALDESINEGLARRLGELQAGAGAVASGASGASLAGGSRDSAAQVLDTAGTVVASSPEVTGQALLGGTELATAARGALSTDHAEAGALAGPVRIAAGPAGGGRVAVVAASLAERDAAVADLGRELSVAFPPVLLAAAVGGYLLAAGALRPVERMRAQAAAITADGSQQRLPVPPARDEIAWLGATLNDLLARLQEALSRERRFVADASHELRTPLSLLTTELELALRRPRGVNELTDALRSVLEETGRLSRLAQDLLLLARSDQLDHPRETTAAHLRPALESVLARYRTAAAPVLDCPDTLTVQVNADGLDRAVGNLIDNALQHGDGAVTVTAHTDHGNTNEPSVAIEVRDHGPGFDVGFLPRAFERFTRADDARTRGGTGLGLAITAALAHRNGGDVRAGNHPDGGAVLTLILPAGNPVAPDDAQVR